MSKFAFPITRFAAVLLAVFPTLLGQSPSDLIEAGHFKRARPLVEARLKANANDASANYDMGRIERAFGNRDAALTYAEKAVALDTKQAKHHVLLAEIVGEAAQHASMFKQIGLAKRMRGEIDAALALDANNIDAMTLSMLYYLNAPGMMGGDKEKGRALADQAVKANPARGYLVKVRLANEEKATDQVEGLLRKAVEADAKLYPARASLTNHLLTAKQFEEAEKHARELLRLDPGRSFGYSALAHVYAAQKKWPELESTLQDSVKNVPDDFAPFYRVGRVLLSNESDLPRAESYFRKYLTQQPEGNQPQQPYAHWSLGLVLEKMGRKADAVTEIAECVKDKPEFEPARKDLARLK
jgi:tetratricopeptide (TPR) repeat protein